jgi:hypothetical protein
MKTLLRYFTIAEINDMTEDEKKSLIYGISQGFDPEDRCVDNWIQKDDADCSWSI